MVHPSSPAAKTSRVTERRALGPDPRERTRGLLALLAVQVMFGLFPVAGKWAFDAFPPAAVAAWRILFGAAALGLGAAWVCRRAALPARRDLPRILLLAVTGVVLNQGLFLEGLKRTQALNTGLLMCLIPVATYGIAVLVGQERPERRRTLALVVAAAGLAPLLVGDLTGAMRPDALGVVLVATNALSYSIFVVAQKPLVARRPALAVIAWVYAGAVLFAPLFVARAGGPAALFPPFEGHGREWASLAYVLLFPTALAYLLSSYALARVRASTVGFFVLLQPLVTGLAGVVVLGERPDAHQMLSALLLPLATWLVVRPTTSGVRTPPANPASEG